MRRFTLATALILATSAPVFAQDANYDADTVMATVNGKTITLGHLIVLMERLPEQYQELPDDQLFKGMLDQLVDQAILADIVQPDPASDDARTQLMMDNERRSILANRMIDDLAAKPVPDEAIQAAYDEQYGNLEPTAEFNASHILVPTAEEAQAIADEIAGGADFAETAKAKSQGPSGPNGGELGWFADGQMVPPFQAAVSTLEVGQVSEPVQTQFGWHVIILNDKRDVPPPTIEEKREELRAEVQQDLIGKQLEELRAGAKVERSDPKVPFSAIRESGLLNK